MNFSQDFVSLCELWRVSKLLAVGISQKRHFKVGFDGSEDKYATAGCSGEQYWPAESVIRHVDRGELLATYLHGECCSLAEMKQK